MYVNLTLKTKVRYMKTKPKNKGSPINQLPQFLAVYFQFHYTMTAFETVPREGFQFYARLPVQQGRIAQLAKHQTQRLGAILIAISPSCQGIFLLQSAFSAHSLTAFTIPPSAAAMLFSGCTKYTVHTLVGMGSAVGSCCSLTQLWPPELPARALKAFKH